MTNPFLIHPEPLNDFDKRRNYCRNERFDDYEQALGDRFMGRVLPANSARTGTPMAPHSVVTMHLIDEEDQPTRAAVDEILAFYTHRLKDKSGHGQDTKHG